MRSLLFSLILMLSLPALGAQATRTSAFEYDANTGLLIKETIEPDLPQLRLDTSYVYDAFGNRTSATISSPATGAAAIVARTTSTTFDANGQFPVTTSNALGHSETKLLDAALGTVTSLTGPNGLTTTWQYDGFGRKTRETRADGTFTQWTYDVCDTACPVNGVYRIVTQVFAGTVQTAPVSVAYFDKLNRAIRSATQSFDGQWVYKDTVYDNQGHKQKVSRPYFVGQTVYWVTSEYDDLGRVVKVYEPDAPDTAALSVTYNGLTVSRTNRKGQVTTEVRNTQGQKASVTDAMGNTTTYVYDPFDGLTRTTDPAGNSIVNVYDTRGRKTQTTDPDLGLWQYEYNALGELTKQTDAKNQITTQSYDKLGRMTQRVEPGLTSTWMFDTAAYGKGKLHQATTNAGYVRTHVYDNKGRPQSTQTNLGTGNPTLSSSVAYDTAGRGFQQTYPSGLSVKQVYNTYGYVSEVRNASTNALYWRADQMDAEGHLLRETTGNGIVTEFGYRPDSGRLENIVANTAAGAQIQGHAYVYDTIGNVTIVADGPGSQLEIRGGYDALNRLTQTDITINGVTTQQNLTYNALGNILSKGGVGNYTYGDALHKHAVTAVTGGPVNLTYSYDANGNLVSGAGRSVSWTAWNMPASITSGGQTQSWTYSPEHDRYKMVATGRTTWYLNPSVHQGGHYEQTLYTSGSTEHRHTLYGGGRAIGEVLTFSGTTPSQTRYFHSDQQGSIVAVTDQVGTVINRYRYDPWGKQTVVLGSNTGIAQTRQGHTAHEMLDNGLTHMNGRLYDPVLSRFVSADPIVDNPHDLQSLNRYVYVNNNPFLFTDPSGFSKWTKFRDKILKPVVAIVAAVFIGPAVYNSVFWSLAGSTSLGVIGGGVIAGAAAGATVGAITGGLYGGAEGALKGAFFGGISGGIFGGIDAYFGAGTYNSSLKGAARYGWSPERIAANSLAGGVTSELRGGRFSDGLKASFVTSALSYMAVSMRASMVDQSRLNPTGANSSGVSWGLQGDGFKGGGSRFDASNLTGLSPLGGQQGGQGFLGITWNSQPLIGWNYAPNSWQDRLVESFSGVHDTFNRPVWYDAMGNIRQGMSKLEQYGGELWNALMIAPAAPFAAASSLPSYTYSSTILNR